MSVPGEFLVVLLAAETETQLVHLLMLSVMRNYQQLNKHKHYTVHQQYASGIMMYSKMD